MRTYRIHRALVAAAVVVIAVGCSRAVAQPTIPNYAYVRDSDGQVWGTYGGQRVAIPIYPATDAQIRALPWNGLWFGFKEDGSGYQPGPKPEWAVNATPAASVPVAAVKPAPSAPVRFAGEQAQNTAPIRLAAGTYVASFKTALRPGQSSCFTKAALHRVDGKRLVETIYSTTLSQKDGRLEAVGETRLYGVAAGEHYLQTEDTGCSWSVELRPA